jgi:hypothetical protein
MRQFLDGFRKRIGRVLPKRSISRNAVLVVIGDGIIFTSIFIFSIFLIRIITL